MSIEQQLSQTLANDVTRYGDGSNITLSEVVTAGRRRRRNSTARRALGSLTALGVTAGGAFALVSAPGAAAWSLTPAPAEVNQRIVELVEDQLPEGTTVVDVDLEAWARPAPGKPSTEADEAPLPANRLAEANAWRATLELDTGARIVVGLAHSKGDTEGDPAKSCAADLAAGYYESCAAEAVKRQGQDIVAIQREGATFVADGHLYGPKALSASERADATPYDSREFEAQPGGDFGIVVLALTPRGGSAVLEQDAMADIALDPSLLAAR